MIEKMIKEIKSQADPNELGMILVHNGIVRATSKTGQPVSRMRLSFNDKMLLQTVNTFKQKQGIVDIRAWINQGELVIGDDIMCLVVAGKFRDDVLPVFKELLTIIKEKIVVEQEIV